MQTEYISLLISILSFLASLAVYFITYRTYSAQLKQMHNKELPNFKIIAVESHINHQTENISVYDGVYCRIYSGESTSNISLNENLAVFDAQKENIEDGFIEEIKSHIGENNTYFTYFGGKPYLIINHALSKERFIIDHSNVIIKLHNYGATISALSIESFIAHYKSNDAIQKIIFNGNIENKITLSPEENNEFVLFFDEVTTDLNNSLCQISPSIYPMLPEYMDLLRTHMVQNRLNYNKLEIKLHCWDLFNNKTIFKITIEYNGNFFISTTSIID